MRYLGISTEDNPIIELSKDDMSTVRALFSSDNVGNSLKNSIEAIDKTLTSLSAFKELLKHIDKAQLQKK